MLDEPTTLASVVFLLADTLKSEYGIDFLPTLDRLGVDLGKRTRPGARVIRSKILEIWEEAEKQSGDSTIGIAVGCHARPQDYYVLGHSWMAASTLRDAFERMIRYREVLTNQVADVTLVADGNAYVVKGRYPDRERMPPLHGLDAGLAALLNLCEMSLSEPFKPIRAELLFDKDRHPEAYTKLFECPIRYGCEHNALWFPAKIMDAPLPSAVPDLQEAVDRIARDYIASFDRSQVATQVRSLLISMLPAGSVDQDAIASRLYCSSSTLQRQLSAEGTSYRDIVAETRESLAKQYLSDPEYSPSEVAYMLGFADQSNFGRAFKRWTGMSPGEFQNAA